MTNVLIWNEYRHETNNPAVSAIYPQGIHAALAEPLRARDFSVRTSILDEPEHGLSADHLAWADVLIWWGHKAHDEVAEERAAAVQQAVLNGLGFIALHSAHFSKPFKRLMGTGCDLKWREAGERERLWVVDPAHPIATGLPENFVLAREEMYGEHFDIPAPDQLVLLSWFQGGEVFRSGCCWQRGRGRVFYFRPGHETYPTYADPTVQMVIANGVMWAAGAAGPVPKRGNCPPIEAF